MMARLLPFPLLTLALLVGWLLLVGSITPGAVLLGALAALGATRALLALTPPRARLRRLHAVPALLLAVLVEIVRSNNAVARIILRPGQAGTRRSGFVRIPLDMRSPYGLAALACISAAATSLVKFGAGK